MLLGPSSETRGSIEAIALSSACQSDNFLNLGREILNQDSRQILNFFEKYYSPNWRLAP